MNNCPECLSPMEAASMGLNPCPHCDVTCGCKRGECATWQVFAEKEIAAQALPRTDARQILCHHDGPGATPVAATRRTENH